MTDVYDTFYAFDWGLYLQLLSEELEGPERAGDWSETAYDYLDEEDPFEGFDLAARQRRAA